MARSLLEEAQTSIQAGEHSAAAACMRVIVVITSPTAVYEADLLATIESDLRASDGSDAHSINSGSAQPPSAVCPGVLWALAASAPR